MKKLSTLLSDLIDAKTAYHYRAAAHREAVAAIDAYMGDDRQQMTEALCSSPPIAEQELCEMLARNAPQSVAPKLSFRHELRELLNKHSMGKDGGDTPDYILADYLITCLHTLATALRARTHYHGRFERPDQR
jgi:hypothetical protein